MKRKLLQVLLVILAITFLFFACEPPAATGPSSDKAITSFVFADLYTGAAAVSGVINETDHTITVLVPYGVDLSAIAPLLSHDGESILPISGAVQDFSSSVIYTVTAEDSSTQDYTVTVTNADLIGTWRRIGKDKGRQFNSNGTGNFVVFDEFDNPTVTSTFDWSYDSGVLTDYRYATGDSFNETIVSMTTGGQMYLLRAEDGKIRDFQKQ